MNNLYGVITKVVSESGKRIKSKAGKIKDVGVKKRWLTEEDIRIERELKAVINKYEPSHFFCAEEENDKYEHADDVWVVDPISGTRCFINNRGPYGIVVAHVHKGKAIFSIVYDPRNDELFTAEKEKGAFLNGNKLVKREAEGGIKFRISSAWEDTDKVKQIRKKLSGYTLDENDGSMAVTECQLAVGRCSGVICLTKDSFPHFASSLIVREAGYQYSNMKSEPDIHFEDRVFVCGDKKVYLDLLKVVN